MKSGEPGRNLANGDLLRIEAITTDGLLVRRAGTPPRRQPQALGRLSRVTAAREVRDIFTDDR